MGWVRVRVISIGLYDEGRPVRELLWLLGACTGWVHRGEQECLASGNLGDDAGLQFRNLR